MRPDEELRRDAIDALALKRAAPRFRLQIPVRIRIPGPEMGVLEEVAATENLGATGAMVPTSLALAKGAELEIEQVEGPLRTLAEVVEVTVGRDGVTRLSLRFLSEAAPEAVEQILRQAGMATGLGQMTMTSEIPASRAAKAAFEQAISKAFVGALGSWHVTIGLVPTFQPPWWLVTVEGREDLFRISLRPSEQDAGFVYSHVREALLARKLVE